MSKPNGTIVFALKSWRIRKNGEKFSISPSVAFEDKASWSKGYKSLQAACAAIARKLAEEWTQRNERNRKFHGRKERAR